MTRRKALLCVDVADFLSRARDDVHGQTGLVAEARGQQVFADGGLWANNPIMVGLVDALTVAPPDQPIEIYSLGTCPRPEGDHLDAESAHRSMLDWSLGADVAPLSISAQEFAFDHMARLLTNAISNCGRAIRRVRFPNKPVPASMMPYLAIDDTRPEATRLRNGLDKAGKPRPIEFVKQGSYAMKTMCRDPDNDYDIDDGVYFQKADLAGDRGAEMTSLQARWMVRDAIDDGKFKQAPEVRSNCVRVFYEKGYHVDMPVYRRVVAETMFGEEVHYELAASSGWKRSDARDVSDWYEDQRAASADGVQLRRINRDLKKYARSRRSWRGSLLSGFGISVLTTDKFRATDREDLALYDTMVAISDRLKRDLEVAHPVTPGDTITSGPDEAKARCFLAKLTEAIDTLAPLFGADCTREKALKCWDKVFATTFFSERLESEQRASVAAPAIIGSAALLSATVASASAVSTVGGGRHA